VERRRFFLLRFVLALMLLALAAAFASAWWLPAVGTLLVENDGPAKSDIGVVLGGDYRGDRIEKAAQLIQAGHIPQALISGPPGFYGLHESDMAIPFIVREGYPAAGFVAVPHDALSTQAEARVMLAELRRRNVRSFLLITSDYHSRRAGRTYRFVGRSMGYLPAMRVVTASDRFFRIDRWWQTREGRKTIFFEWTKTLAFAVGL
jgi:uncharacterized SAM-binding protein YcdF (DUF218 family)